MRFKPILCAMLLSLSLALCVTRARSQNPSNIESLDWSPDGSNIAIGGFDGTVRVMNVASRAITHTFVMGDAPIYTVDWNPDSTRLAGGDELGTVIIWDVETESRFILHSVPPGTFESAALSIDWSPGGAEIAVGSAAYPHDEDGLIEVFDAATGQRTQVLVIPGGGDVNTVAWSRDGTRIAAATSNGPQIITVSTSEIVNFDEGLPVDGVSWNPNGDEVVFGVDFELPVWNVQTQQIVMQLNTTGKSSVYTIAWSPDGSWIASGDEEGGVYIWDAVTGHLLAAYYNPGYSGLGPVAWSPDGRKLAYGTTEGTVKITCD